MKKKAERYKGTDKTLNPNTITCLLRIFDSKSWVIEDDADNQSSLFNRFCALLSELSDQEQNLILELTERFTVIPSEQYSNHIKNILNLLAADTKLDISKINSIFIAPLIAPEDLGKSKSSTYVQYSFQEQFHYNNDFAKKNIQYLQGLNADSTRINNEESLLFVVDDFIGTGDTAVSALNHLFSECGIDNTKVIVISIAALNQGISKITELGVRVFTSLSFPKGISEYYPSSELPSKLTIMESIEENIKIHKNEKLGYGKSEALIKMIRTPNNTLPVFWKEKKGRVAPFPR